LLTFERGVYQYIGGKNFIRAARFVKAEITDEYVHSDFMDNRHTEIAIRLANSDVSRLVNSWQGQNLEKIDIGIIQYQ